MDDTAVSASKQGVVVANYYQIQNKDDTPGAEDSVFSSIRDNEVKNMEEDLNEGEYVKINKKVKIKINKRKRKYSSKKI